MHRYYYYYIPPPPPQEMSKLNYVAEMTSPLQTGPGIDPGLEVNKVTSTVRCIRKLCVAYVNKTLQVSSRFLSYFPYGLEIVV